MHGGRFVVHLGSRRVPAGLCEPRRRPCGEVGRAHGEVFGQVRPASTVVEVSRLIDPALLVEVEADAVVV